MKDSVKDSAYARAVSPAIVYPSLNGPPLLAALDAVAT